MSEAVYTLGVWRTKAGREQEFVSAWLELGRFFRQLERPPGPGMLLQSLDDSQQFYSFGPWGSLEDIAAMRAHPQTGEMIGKLRELCEIATPGGFRVVATA